MMQMEINVGNALKCRWSNAVNCLPVVGVMIPFYVGSECGSAPEPELGPCGLHLQHPRGKSEFEYDQE